MKTQREAERILQQNHIRIDTTSDVRLIILGKEGPGLHLWGVIDCLCNFYEYRWVRDHG